MLTVCTRDKCSCHAGAHDKVFHETNMSSIDISYDIQYNVLTKNKFDPFLKEEEKSVVRLCKKLLYEARLDLPESNACSALKRYKESLEKYSHDIRVGVLCEMVADKYNEYRNLHDVSEFNRLRNGAIVWSKVSDLFSSATNSSKLILTCRPLTCTINDCEEIEQIALRRDSDDSYLVIRNKWCNSKRLTNLCDSLFYAIQNCHLPIDLVDEIPINTTTSQEADVLLFCERASSKYYRFDVTVMLLCEMLLSKVGRRDSMVYKNIKERLQNNYPLFAGETIFKCYPFTFVVHKDYRVDKVILKKEVGCISIVTNNSKFDSAREKKIEILCESMFQEAKWDLSCGDADVAADLFKQGLTDYSDDIRVVVLCDILATKYLLDRNDFDVSHHLFLVLPKLKQETTIIHHPFKFIVAPDYTVKRAMMFFASSFYLSISNRIEMYDCSDDE